MIFSRPLPEQNPLRAAITHAYYEDETACVNRLIEQATLPSDALIRVANNARQLVQKVRDKRLTGGGLDAFLYEYDLSSSEGIALMCLAEALLRIPDKKTIDDLLRDKITSADWAEHIGQSDSLFVNAATWGLVLTGKILTPKANKFGGVLKKFVERSSAPIIRKAVKQAMKLLGHQFVMGETIELALKRAQESEARGYRYSYDMLGEAARTSHDADRYFQSYQRAIDAIGKAAKGKGCIEGPGISIKLSALHPRYEFAQRETVVPILIERLKALAVQAKAYNIGLTVDAEEAERLDISLDIIEAVFADPMLKDWNGFGLAVQSYQKRAPFVIDWLVDLARKHQRRWMVRLIKGAYWDAEIKNAQVKGLEGYPVFTRKAATDVSFIACAKKILQFPNEIYPQFATHNAYTLSAVLEMAGSRRDFEFQCLHGMGHTLYDQVVGLQNLNIPARVYAPVGGHEDLLAYLVRRLLENGANTSFVNRIVDENVAIDDIIADPVAKMRALGFKPHPKIPLPCDIYGEERKNSHGIDLTDEDELRVLQKAMEIAGAKPWTAAPIIDGKEATSSSSQLVKNPANHTQVIGQVTLATVEQTEQALASAHQATFSWDMTPVNERADCLDRAADLFEQRMPDFMALAVREGGKTMADAIAEIREAVDFCRYYAARAREDLAIQPLPGPTGEMNRMSLHGRGVIACISPWNFPLAIFIGQVTAALAAGNTVIAKPAGQTPLIAAAAVRLLHEAGIPKEVLHLLPGSGSVVGAKLVADERVRGIVFTGSTETARGINQTLANREGPITPFIAETGGQNAMIVDSSALPEQVVADVINSAFGSAGQRCSALRVLFLQEDIAPKIIEMLRGAMAELRVDDPSLLSTDIGPVIDEAARQTLQDHINRMHQEATLIYQVSLPATAMQGTFFAPCAFEIDGLSRLKREVFGPVLHIIRYRADEIDKVIAAINNTGYGLTFGIQSRIDSNINYICERLRVGNQYVNRSMIGAIVGVQPFGGESLSGTGPKAGGPHYLLRLCTERSLSVNTTAAGGNASLLCLEE